MSLIQSQIHQPVINLQHRLRKMWIIYINREDPIKDQGALDENNHHQTSYGKYNIKISLCKKKSYQRTDIEIELFHI